MDTLVKNRCLPHRVPHHALAAQLDLPDQLLFSGVKFPTDKRRISCSKLRTSAADRHADILIFNRFGHRFHLRFVDSNVVNFEADAVGRMGTKNFGNIGFETSGV
jgi:hypothetical protein